MSYGDFVIFDVKKIKKFTNGEFSRTSGTASLGLAFAGEPGPGASPTTSTEEWTKAVGARTIDVS